MVWEALEAAKAFEEEGIEAEVINTRTVKPLDELAVLKSVKKTGCVVSAEEHNYWGGLGESIASLLSRYWPAPMEMVAVQDSFGESGTPDELMTKYGLKAMDIVAKAKRVIARKTKR